MLVYKVNKWGGASGITAVEVAQVTKNFVHFNDSSQELKDNPCCRYFDNKQEAQLFLIRRAEVEFEVAEAELMAAESAYTHARKVLSAVYCEYAGLIKEADLVTMVLPVLVNDKK